MRRLQTGFFLLLLSTARSQTTPAAGPFLESEAPFLNSALIIKEGKKINPVRRGILIPLGESRWACFDTDLLRWAAIWKAPKDSPPLTLSSMAAVSYPEGKAKAKKPPALRGELIFTTPALPGAGSRTDDRPTLRAGSKLGSEKVGPFPILLGRWLGLELRGEIPVLKYRLQDATISEFIPRGDGQNLRRVIEVSSHKTELLLHLGPHFKAVTGSGASLRQGVLRLSASSSPRVIVAGTESAAALAFPPKIPLNPIFPERIAVANPDAMVKGPYTIRPLALPQGSRYIRPTDLAFFSDGSALLATLDGDLWRIESPNAATSHWTRVASGLFETISVEITPDDRVFTLGRDQITEFIDHNADGHFDHYRNASNAFHQTLQTRDYATSLAIGPDRSFYLAKGGINKNEGTKDNELSLHRGAILKIAPDGDTVEVLADGLRLPYVGLRKDGAVFASDQQGNHVPSTPIHLITAPTNLGYVPTNHRQLTTSEPLLWYPYQANRSAAAFGEWGERFLQASWDGRLFAIQTPPTGQAFSWQLPLQLNFPTLNAVEDPISGRLFVTGLGISGYKPTTPQFSGIASIEESTPFPQPISLDVQSQKITLTFDRPLSEEETILPASPALRLFDVKRTSKYGSGHFRWDGTAGEHRFQPSTFKMSEDRRTFTMTFEPLSQSHLFDLHLTISSGTYSTPLHLFTRPSHLPKADLQALATQQKAKPVLKAGDATKGKALFTTYACAGCHALDQTKLVGPSLKGIATRADEASLRESILDPTSVITEGFEASMPSFAGVLSEQQLADLIAYLQTLH